jgi:hypothetical protein
MSRAGHGDWPRWGCVAVVSAVARDAHTLIEVRRHLMAALSFE